MSNASQQIVNKAWNFAHVLRDDGLSYMAYTEQITFLLFLKMADEQTKPPYKRPAIVPAKMSWESLVRLDGEALELAAGHYRVTIATSPPRTIEAVEVPGEQLVVLKAGGS